MRGLNANTRPRRLDEAATHKAGVATSLNPRLRSFGPDRLLFGVTALGPMTYAAAIGVLAVIANVAALVPARRAAMLDPARALQIE